MIKVELAHYVPLVRSPLRRRMRCNLRGIILEWKPCDFVRLQRARIQPKVLIASFFRGMLLWITPTELHRSRGAGGCVRQIVGEHASRNLSAVDVDLHSRCSAGTVVSKEDMPPCAIDRQRR